MLIYSRQADWLVALEIFTMIILHVFITTSLSFFSVPSFTMQNFGVETSRFML
jgi:biotin transporter BioY